MIHKLCAVCINPCKQNDNVKIRRCPKFIKRVSENEFNDLVDDLDSMSKNVEDLSARAKKLIDLALESHDFPTENINDTNR